MTETSLNARHYLRARGGTGGTTGGVSAQEIALDNLRRQTTQDDAKQQRPVSSEAKGTNTLTLGSMSRNSRLTRRNLPSQAVITLTTTREVLGDDGNPVPETDSSCMEAETEAP